MPASASQRPEIMVRAAAQGELHLLVRPDVAEALISHIRRALDEWGEARTGELAAHALLGAFVTVTESDARPPTAAQVKFALDIVRKLGVELPIGTLQDRARMGAFLTKYASRV